MPARPYVSGSTDPAGSVDRPVRGRRSDPSRTVPAPPSSALPARGRIAVHGVVERITIAPVTASPSFRALARVGSNGSPEHVLIVWMGRRRVPGVEAGVALRFEGMLSRVAGTPTVYNPRYEIIGRPEDH